VNMSLSILFQGGHPRLIYQLRVTPVLGPREPARMRVVQSRTATRSCRFAGRAQLTPAGLREHRN
jgi:hypothetical protein